MPRSKDMATLHYVEHKKSFSYNLLITQVICLLRVIENTSTGSERTIIYSITHYIILSKYVISEESYIITVSTSNQVK